MKQRNGNNTPPAIESEDERSVNIEAAFDTNIQRAQVQDEGLNKNQNTLHKDAPKTDSMGCQNDRLSLKHQNEE